jgi:hypothetical protein
LQHAVLLGESVKRKQGEYTAPKQPGFQRVHKLD